MILDPGKGAISSSQPSPMKSIMDVPMIIAEKMNLEHIPSIFACSDVRNGMFDVVTNVSF